MDNLVNLFNAVAPNGLWEKIIIAFEGSLGSFALSIVLLTIIIKILMTPIDFFNRRTNKKMATMQKKIQPQVEAISKKYAKDEKTKNQKLGELYQREKINPLGSCFVMLLNMGLTLAIFITLLNGMNTMARYKIVNQYEQIQVEYVQEYVLDTYSININDVISENEAKADDDETKKSLFELLKPYIVEMQENESAMTSANARTAQKFAETKESFLWIDNIWIADSPFKDSIPTFKQYAGVAGIKNNDENYEQYEQVYNQIMDPIRETNGRVNGFYILLVLCAGVAFLNQWLLTRRSKKEGAQASSKAMLVVMPLIMAIFTLFYTTMFSLYMLTSQIVSIATLPLIGKISDLIDARQEKKNVPTDRLKRI